MSHLQKAGRRHTRTHAEHARARARTLRFFRPALAERSSRSAPAFRRRGLQMITSIHILKNGGKEFRTRSARPAPGNRRRPGAWGNRFAPGRTRQLVHEQISCGTTGYRSGYDVWLLVPWQVQFIMKAHGHYGFASIRLKKAMESVVRPTAPSFPSRPVRGPAALQGRRAAGRALGAPRGVGREGWGGPDVLASVPHAHVRCRRAAAAGKRAARVARSARRAGGKGGASGVAAAPPTA